MDEIRYLKRRIRIFVGIVLAAVMAISAWSIVAEHRHIIAAAERQTAGYAQALSEHAESSFAEADRVARDVVHTVALMGGVERVGRRQLFELLRRQGDDAPQIGSLFLVDSRGRMVVNTVEFSSRQIPVADREYFRHYLDDPGADLYLSKPVMSRLVNRWRFNLIRPLNPPHARFAGLLAVAFEVRYFKRFFSASSLGPHGRVMLIRDDGAPLVFEPEIDKIYQADFRNSQLFRTWLPKAPEGTFSVETSVIDRGPRIVSYKRLSRFPVVAVVSLNRDDVLAPWTRKSLLQAAVTLVLCIVILYLTRLLFRHLDRLQLARSGFRAQQEQVRVKAAQIDAANDAIVQCDLAGRLVHFNQALSKITHFPADELAGMSLYELAPPESAAQLGFVMQRVAAQGEATFESAYRTRDGGIVPVEVHAHRMESDGATFILSIARDVHERKLAERREQTRLAILEEMATGATLPELLLHIVNFVEQQSPGAICSVLLADETGRLRHGAAPNLPDEYNRAVDGLRIGEGIGSCGTAAHRKQRVIVAEIEGHPFWKGFAPAREAGLRACWSQPILSSAGELFGTFAVYYREPRSPAEDELALIESAAHLASIAIGRVRGEEHRKLLEEQLRHVQKIEAIGQLTGGIAHDFNNLLTPILVYADMIMNDAPAGSASRLMSDRILKAARKARDLTQKLLSFGRRQILKMQPLDLNEVIRSFHDILRSTIRESITIRMDLTPDGAAVLADRGQLEQILLNLAVNAQDAIGGNGVLTIETGHVLLDDEYARLHPGMRPGAHIMLAVTDDGCGMDNGTLQHIFEPFFTTKQVGHGTGLGLATVYGAVKQHNGYIAVASKVGTGTTFTIYLPASSAAAEAAREEARNDDPLAGVMRNRTVLVVEDNEMVREMAVELLAATGFRVLVAATPAEACELVQARRPVIDLLVTDVVMPEMNGHELYDRLAAEQPGLPVLFISGYTNEVVVHNGTLEEGVNFLQKPFTREQFVGEVVRMLQETP